MMIEGNEIQMHSFSKERTVREGLRALHCSTISSYIEKIYVSRILREFLADFLEKMYLFISMKAIIDLKLIIIQYLLL